MKIASIIEDIARERARQISVKGYGPAHDDYHDFEELACAAATYALGPCHHPLKIQHRDLWPFIEGPKFKDRRTDLIRAGALIVAEIERLDRAAEIERASQSHAPEVPGEIATDEDA